MSLSDEDVGGSGNVQSGQNQGAGGLAGLFGGTNVADPNASAYNANLGMANTGAQTSEGLGYGGYTQQGATINNPYAAQSQSALSGTNGNLSNLAALQMQTAQGQGPAVQAAQAQMQQATNQGIAAQTAMARSATGGALAQNAAQMQAQGNAAQLQGNAAAQSQQTLAQMAQAAAAQAGQTYGTQGGLQLNQYQLEQQNAQQQAALQQQNQAQQGQMQLGYLNNATQEQGQGLNALNSYGNQLLGSEGLAQQEGQQQLSDVGNAIQGGASMGMSIASLA